MSKSPISNPSTLSRRALCQRAAMAVPMISAVALAAEHASAADLPAVSVDDPQAKALQYTEQTPDPNKRCDNCQLWQGGDAERGGCAIFAGKSVTSAGWCSAWVQKA